MTSTRTRILHMTTAALFLAAALYLPFLTGQIPEIGNALCPMHIPVLLAGFFCGPLWGGAVGLTAPLLRSLLFGMPTLFPKASAMAVELFVYGLMAGLLFLLFRKSKGGIYPSLLFSMLLGRAAWGGISVLFFGMKEMSFTWSYFYTEAFVLSLPGILLQLILVPLLVVSLEGAYRRIAEP